MRIAKLVGQHIDTMAGKGETVANLLVYFGIPAAASMLFTVIDYQIGGGLFMAMIISISIFSSLLFSLHMMIYTYMKKAGEAEASMMGYLFKLYINISFCILVAVTAVTLLFTYGLKNRVGGGAILPLISGTVSDLASIDLLSKFSQAIDLLLVFVIYFLLFVFLGTLFMVLGRIHEIIDRDQHIQKQL